MSSIFGINPLQISSPISPIGAESQSGEFKDILLGTINSLEGLNNNASDAINKFLTGQSDELHQTILETQKAGLAFQLGLQVRNKVVDAYQEVMKMQI